MATAFVLVKLCRLTLCLAAVAEAMAGEVADAAGLPGLLGAVLEPLEVFELFGVLGVVVVELPPEETIELSDTEAGKAVEACEIQIIDISHLTSCNNFLV